MFQRTQHIQHRSVFIFTLFLELSCKEQRIAWKHFVHEEMGDTYCKICIQPLAAIYMVCRLLPLGCGTQSWKIQWMGDGLSIEEADNKICCPFGK